MAAPYSERHEPGTKGEREPCSTDDGVETVAVIWRRVWSDEQLDKLVGVQPCARGPGAVVDAYEGPRQRQMDVAARLAGHHQIGPGRAGPRLTCG